MGRVCSTSYHSAASPRRASRRPALWRLLLAGVTIYGAALSCWWLVASTGGDADAPISSSKWLAVHRQSLGLAFRRSRTNATGSQGNATLESLELDVGSAPSNATAAKLSCVGWRQTGGCDPNGPRESNNDQPCDKPVTGGASGYCALVDERTGQEVRAMQLTCESVRRDVEFRCEDAVAFVAFQAVTREKLTEATALAATGGARAQDPARHLGRHGIVMVMYPKLLVSVYASLRMLRALNCALPVELWYLSSEMSAETIASDPILHAIQKELGPVSLHGIAETQIAGFNSKVHAILHTTLDVVLFMDADNVPARDPTFLFTSAELVEHGAVFWPDFWHPRNTIFNVQRESLLWDLVGIPFVDMMEQESGQLLVDRRRSAAALSVLELFAFHQPSFFERLRLVHGDKDLFRLAWLSTNTSFYMVQRPPGAAGKLNAAGVFCGMTMVQFDPAGRDVLFLHRNAQKLSKDKAALTVWSHLQTFEADNGAWYDAVKKDFVIAIYGGGDTFPETAMCYGERRESAGRSGRFKTVAWDQLPDPALRDLEPKLLRFAQDALALK